MTNEALTHEKKPFIMAVDDDPQVLRAIGRDLRQHYGSRYRVVTADSGAVALDTVRELKRRNDDVALFVVDQRMPGMSGVEFLKASLSLCPQSQRVLLTAYADIDAAIRAINEARIDYYLTKPWDPPEERLYPVLDDLLEDWLGHWRPAFQGVRIVGHRWSADGHRLRDFCSRHEVPYRWIDIEAPQLDAADRELLEAARVDAASLPVVVLPDGAVLPCPTTADLAERLHMPTHAEKKFYDFIIIGGGPAGLAAGVYGASEGLSTVLVERDAPGGQVGTTSRIENYLGFPRGLTGADLARRAVTQARRFGVDMLVPRAVTGLRTQGDYRVVTLDDGTELTGHAVLIAVGLAWRRLDIEGLQQFEGAGVYYGAALSEALNCKDEDVYLVGGANSVGQAALHFARHARNVYILVRGDGLSASMSHYLIRQIDDIPNIHLRTRTQVVAVRGDGHLEEITLRTADGEQAVPCSNLYIFIGARPMTDWLRGVVPLSDDGYILCGPQLPRGSGRLPNGWPLERDPFLFETLVPGVFAAGDVRWQSVKRCASGVGEGSICVQFVHQYLSGR